MVIKTENTAESEWLRSLLGITKPDLIGMEERIMRTIKEFSDAQAALLQNLSDNVDALSTSVSGISDDVSYLKETIDKLNSTPGELSAEDQMLLDEAVARVTTVADKLTLAKDALAALDAATSRPAPEPAPEA